MDSNALQRKRGVRTPKNANTNENSQSQNIDNDEDIQVAAVAISPTLEESEIATNAPVAECRRSSRKKIIKFDVRDLLNKNRKTHKIQIEARIDSNAPTTSKAASVDGIQAANSQTSLTAREDLLSKQKTFLEKSAIFRRYSISQEHKPPPPLPIPPLLGKTNDGKDNRLPGNSSSRRLSRTQEFFSNVMIKPKQTTSLIVAQIESNTPSSVAAAKRKNLCKPTELAKFNTTAETGSPPALQQKRRGRPTKTKTQTSVEILNATTVKKSITPEKAKNWKEYKACLAQQSSSSFEEKNISKTNDEDILSSQEQRDQSCILLKKQKKIDDALQSDISRSDDDGNFSGFHTSKDDISCDSPVLAKKSLGENVCITQSLESPQLGENRNNKAKNDVTTNVFETEISKNSSEKEQTTLVKTDKIMDTSLNVIDSKQNEKLCSTLTQENISEKKQTQDKQNLKETKIDETDFANVEPELLTERNLLETKNQILEPELSNEIIIQEEISNKTSDTKGLDLSADEDVKSKALEISNDPSENNEMKSDNNTNRNRSTIIEEKIIKCNFTEEVAESQDVQDTFASSDKIEAEGVDNITFEQDILNKSAELSRYSPTVNVKIENYETLNLQSKLQNDILKTALKQCEKIKPKEAPVASVAHETQSDLKCSPQIKIANNIFLLTNETSQTLPSTTLEESKSSLSRTSSSSESENTFERSSYSSEPFSTTSSSSYKSSNKLKVSVKRISLPKSPSTSSQTSTSEEFNNAVILKRKPPMAKRSKRLQKKFEETLENENINNCFQQIPNVENTEQPNLNEQISVKQSSLGVEKEIYAINIKEDASAKLFENVKLISQETKQDSYESCTATETTDSASNESSNVEYLSVKEKIVKRKSLRTRKDNRSHDKDIQQPYKSKEIEKQIEKVDERKEQEEQIFGHEQEKSIIIKQQKLNSMSSEEDKQKELILENAAEQQVVDNNLKLEKASGSDQSSERISNNQDKKLSFVKEEKKLVARDEKSKFQIEISDTNKIEEVTTLKKKKKLSNEDKISYCSKTKSNDQEIEACESNVVRTKSEVNTKALTTISLKNEEEKSAELLNIQAKIDIDLLRNDTTLKKLSTQLSSENNDGGDLVGPKSKEVEENNIEIGNIQNKSLSASTRSNKADKEKVSKTALERSKQLVTITAKVQDEKVPDDEKLHIENLSKHKAGVINESLQIGTLENTRIEIESPTQSLTAIDTKSSIKNKNSKFQNKKLNDDELEKAEFQKESVQGSKIKTCSGLKNKPMCAIAKSSQGKIKSSNEKLALAKKEATDDKTDDKTIISTDDKIIKEKILLKEEKDQEKQLNIEDKDTSLDKVSRKYKKVATKLKMLDLQSPDKIEFSDEKSFTPNEDTEVIKAEKVIKTTTAKSKKDVEEVSSKESGKEVKCLTQHEATSTKYKSKKVEASKKMTDNSHFRASKIKEDHLPKERKVAENMPDDKLLKESLESKEIRSSTEKVKETETEAKSLRNKKDSVVSKSKLNKDRTSPITLKSASQKDFDSTQSNEMASSNLPTKTTQDMLIGNSVSSLVSNLEIEIPKQNTHQTCPHTSAKSSPKLFTLNKNILSEPAEFSKLFPESSLATETRKPDKDGETLQLREETFTTNTYQEDSSQENKEQISVTPLLTKRRGKKSRFKNLHGPEIDSETDNNGKTTPVDEVTLQLQIETKSIQKQQADKAAQIQETNTNICGIQPEQLEDVTFTEQPVSAQEKSQANLSSSQIKNVSIETNTLLDILRRVQSNTEAALKATKSPIQNDKNDNEYTIESTTKMKVETSLDLLKIQQESKTVKPTRLDTQSPLTAKVTNLSPARSDTSSPLTLKKVTSSPTRSESSSPLTLKKVTRRYERRSRRGDDSAHKTLEETFAEIAAQSSKAVLAAKEFDINEEQTIDKKSPIELADMNTGNDIEKEQTKETFIDFEKSTQSEITFCNVIQKDDETILNVLQDVDKTSDVSKEQEDELRTTDNLVEVETTKVAPVKRGRKPKNRSLEATMTETKEILEYDTNTLKTEAKITTEGLAQETKTETDAVEVAKKETIKEDDTNETKKTNETPETIKTGNSLETKISSPIASELQVASKESPNSSQTPAVENIRGNKSSKKIIKKRDAKAAAATEDDTLVSNSVICKNQEEEEIQSPKQAIKKRDPSSSKSESKSLGKKQSKKTKNEEEESLNLRKEENVSKTTAATPPPSKRGRKPKNQQSDTPQNTTSSKKKYTKKDSTTKNEEEEDMNIEKEQVLEPESECLKSLDEKLAKKKRQKKLKEAFEAALIEDIGKTTFTLPTEISSPTSNSSLGLTLFNNSPPPSQKRRQSTSNEEVSEAIKVTCLTPVEKEEEDSDPLRDIEKFIADGVNLLKKDYKLDEDSVDDVIQSTHKTTQIIEEPVKIDAEEAKLILNAFETPADTPLNTPSATPPPLKSPISIELSATDENSGVRRSHRIKLITKTPKALVGRGLVRDKERFSIKDDVETKSHYSLDDHLTDLAEVEAKNAKFLKEMEERLSNFQVIKENDYLCERVISKEARKMICDCFLTHEEEERGELGCGEDCLNRLLMIECGPECNVKERCTNKRFQKLLCSPCRVFRTEKKGFGIMADIEILPGEFIMEYVGEVIDTEEFEKRRITYSQDKNRHYYFMALRSDAIIDATVKGNISRFINHSCDPNAETQKWTVNGELRIGFFSRKSIMPGEEITFNYQYQRYGREAQRCYCESSNCRGWIGQEPNSDEGEQMDDDDESEYEEEETDTSNLLVHDDDEESDASVTDPEEVQKQLEMAAAQAEVELAPLQLLNEKAKQADIATNEGKSMQDLNKSDNEEDSKSKFKKLLSKMAEKVAAKQKQNKRQQKLQRKKKSKESSSELANKLRFLEDPDIEDEVEFLKECGLKNQSDTLRLSRLMVRAKLVQTRLNLLEILRKGDFPCRRLFLDYHGLRLLHGWMSEDGGNMQIRLAILQTLETLPIPNKTVLTDSKVMQVVRNWCGTNTNLSLNEDSSSSNSNSQDVPVQGTTNFEEDSAVAELQKLGLKLITTWEGLPEIFRIPKKERIEQMKEHEREADRQYAANAEAQENTTATNRYRTDRYCRYRFGGSPNAPSTSNRFVKPNNGNPLRTTNTTPESNKNLSKAQRREMFAAKVARDEAVKRLTEERREFETKCRFFGLDPKKTRTQDIPFCVNPATGQWFSIERKPITTPPSYAHVQVPVKPKSTDPNDYQLPAVCSSLPPQWKYAITPQSKIYYYHVKHRIPQWEPPTPAQLQQCDLEAKEEDSESELTTTAGEDSSDDDDDVLIGMDAVQLKAYIDRKVEIRRQKRYQRLVDERSISPRREEDRIYNQIEVRKYKENKEKIRKRKEDMRRKRAEALRQTSLNMCTLGSITEANSNSNTNKSNAENNEKIGVLPIQDYLLSSDEEIDLKAEVNSPLIDKIVEGDKIVDELDALTTKRQLKRPLPPHRNLNEHSTSSSAASTSASILNTLSAKQEYKKRKLEKKEKRRPKEQDAKYRKNKEKFRCDIAGIIVHHLKPYLKETCIAGRIQSNEDFNHLARKLTHFVMIKELKYCESVGQTLVVTESVKSKSREFIKKYMAKYSDVYVKPTNDPDFKDIPFTL